MLLSCVFFFFFFKQKTAYEMRISDWSSDVCSSDLATYVDNLYRLCDGSVRLLSSSPSAFCSLCFLDGREGLRIRCAPPLWHPPCAGAVLPSDRQSVV